MTAIKVGFLVLLMSVWAASNEVPNGSLTLTWDPCPISDKVTSYRVYELVKSRSVLIWQSKRPSRVLIGQSKTPRLVIPRKKGKHVYVVTAVNTKGESAPSASLQVRN